MSKIEAAFNAAAAAIKQNVPADLTEWAAFAESVILCTPTLSPSDQVAVDGQLASMGLGNLRAKAAFSHRAVCWAAARAALVQSWATAKSDDEPSKGGVDALVAFRSVHAQLAAWNDAHGTLVCDIGRGQDLFKTDMDLEVLLPDILGWGDTSAHTFGGSPTIPLPTATVQSRRGSMPPSWLTACGLSDSGFASLFGRKQYRRVCRPTVKCR